MKKKNIVLAIAGVFALVTGLTVSTAHGSELCSYNKVIASSAMSLRIDGVPKDDVDDLASSEQALAIIAMAYARTIPENMTASNKVKQMKEFAEEVYKTCITVTNRQKYGNNWQKVDGVAI